MEHPVALTEGNGTYQWHAGSPDDVSYQRAHQELILRVEAIFKNAGLGELAIERIPMDPKPVGGVSDEYVVEAFGRRLVKAGERHKELVVLDGDLAADCRTRYFELAYPTRYIQSGIAEQDMVSMAGAMARGGLLPVVNSFATFLAARANEQIYNNCTEGSKVIYVCHFGGLIPAGPGLSHQSVRDISLFGALPNCTILSPCNARETEMALDWCIEGTPDSSMLRLAIGPSPRRIALPPGYTLQEGRGAILREGTDVLALSYGPVLLHELLTAAEALVDTGLSVAVVNMPWLNRVDRNWFVDLATQSNMIVSFDDHSNVGGLGDRLVRELVDADVLRNRRAFAFGVTEYPVSGAPGEVLRYHRLDAQSMAERILAAAAQSGVRVPAGTIKAIRSQQADAAIG